jgi:hypothetical protein
MTRPITDDERAVLAHVLIDPDAWWAHVQSAPNGIDPEAIIAEKVSRWRPAYLAARQAEGDAYMARSEREPE